MRISPKLRTYQQDAVTKFRESLIDTGRGQIVLATGLGKTVDHTGLRVDVLIGLSWFGFARVRQA